jgi:hypothetical protein
VEVITDVPPKVQAWRCAECGTDWALTVVNPQLRQRYLDELAGEVATRAVLREVTTLAEQADTLAAGQLRARLISPLARLDQICRWGADPHAPAGHRPTNEFPTALPVPDPSIAGTRITR